MRIDEIILRIILATVCGTIIGYDRAKKGRNAGTKTHTLVSIGSALAMIVGESLYMRYGNVLDITRMASQVIAGIGFLGAGAIIVTGEKKVVGLTTAATLWLSAIVGISSGAGMFTATIAAMIGWAITFSALNFIDNNINKKSTSLTIFIKLERPANKLMILEFLKSKKCEIISLEKVMEDDLESNNEFHYMGNLSLDFNTKKEDLINELKEKDGIIYVNTIDEDV